MAVEEFYVGKTAVVAIRLWSVDPITGARSPEPAASSVTIRFKEPGETVLAERTLSAGVENAGEGWYWASATPEVEGLHEVEIETGATYQGREKMTFGVSPF